MTDTVSENVRKPRQKKGIPHDQLLKNVDLLLSAVTEIETGEKTISLLIS